MDRLKAFWKDKKKRNAVLIGGGVFLAIYLWRKGTFAGMGGPPQLPPMSELMAPVYFGFGQMTPSQADQQRLTQLGQSIAQSNRRLIFTGHTDTIGADADNVNLGRARAQAVARIVAQAGGVRGEQLEVQSAGESQCRSAGQDQACRYVSIQAAA